MDLDIARGLIAAARESGSRRQLQPLSVVVLDAGGQVRAFEREDGASNARFEIAFGKANGALALGMGSRSLMARAEQQPSFIAAATAAVGGSLIPVPGGVLVQTPRGRADRGGRDLRRQLRQRRGRGRRRDRGHGAGGAHRVSARSPVRRRAAAA